MRRIKGKCACGGTLVYCKDACQSCYFCNKDCGITGCDNAVLFSKDNFLGPPMYLPTLPNIYRGLGIEEIYEQGAGI